MKPADSRNNKITFLKSRLTATVTIPKIQKGMTVIVVEARIEARFSMLEVRLFFHRASIFELHASISASSPLNEVSHIRNGLPNRNPTAMPWPITLLFFFHAGMLFLPVAFLDLLGTTFLWFCFQLLRVLTLAITHLCSLLVAIDFGILLLDADALSTWQKIRQTS